MATNTQRIDQLEKLVYGLSGNEKAMKVRLERLDEADARVEAAAITLREDLNRLRQKSAEAEQRIAVLETVVKELNTASEKWGQRWWQLVAALLIAAVSVQPGISSNVDTFLVVSRFDCG